LRKSSKERPKTKVIPTQSFLVRRELKDLKDTKNTGRQREKNAGQQPTGNRKVKVYNFCSVGQKGKASRYSGGRRRKKRNLLSGGGESRKFVASNRNLTTLCSYRDGGPDDYRRETRYGGVNGRGVGCQLAGGRRVYVSGACFKDQLGYHRGGKKLLAEEKKGDRLL